MPFRVKLVQQTWRKELRAYCSIMYTVFYSQKPSFDAEQKNVKRFLKAVTYTDDRPSGTAENTILEFGLILQSFPQLWQKFNIKNNTLLEMSIWIVPTQAGIFSNLSKVS